MIDRAYRADLVGITIEVGGQLKFVGKVGTAPAGSHPVVEGCPIFYREAEWAQVYCRAKGAISVDRHVWDAARAFGAQAMAVYLTDKRTLVVALAGRIEAAPVVDYGQRPQYRIPIDHCNAYRDAASINMGWTSRAIRAEDVLGEPEQARQRPAIAETAPPRRSAEFRLFSDLKVGDHG